MTQPAGDRRLTETLAQTIDRLRSHQKPNRGAPAYSRFVNRPLGRVIAAAGFRAGLTPNRVTAISGTLSLVGIALIATTRPTASLGIAVAVLLALGYAFDSADGQLARLLGGGSAAGEWLDHVVDCAKISLLHLGVLLSLQRTDVARGWLLLPIAFVFVANLFFFSFILTELLTRTRRVGPAPEKASSSVLRSLVVAPTDYGLLCVAFLIWGWTSGFLLVYGLLMLGTAGYVALGLPKWFRDMRSLDTRPTP